MARGHFVQGGPWASEHEPPVSYHSGHVRAPSSSVWCGATKVPRKFLELCLTILSQPWLQSVLAHVSCPQAWERWGQLSLDCRTRVWRGLEPQEGGMLGGHIKQVTVPGSETQKGWVQLS